MSNLADNLMNAIKVFYPVDTVGDGHINETPFVLFRFTEENYKIGYKGTIQLRLIAKDEVQISKMLKTVKEILEYKAYGRYLIRKIDYTIPQPIEWTDKRWFQDLTVSIIFEEV